MSLARCLGVGFPAESNCWNMNGTSNLKTVRKKIRVLSYVTSDDVLAQPSILFSVELLRTKFQVPNFSIFMSMITSQRKTECKLLTATEYWQGESL